VSHNKKTKPDVDVAKLTIYLLAHGITVQDMEAYCADKYVFVDKLHTLERFGHKQVKKVIKDIEGSL